MPVAIIESLDAEGRGVTHVDGKAIFVEGALPREKVEYSSYRKKPSFEQANVSRVIKASAQRAKPGCKFFGICGGCSFQHAELGMQVAAKQRAMEDALKHIGKVAPGSIYPAIYGPTWGYRYRARIGVRVVVKKGVSAGDVVVTSGQVKLENGSLVQIAAEDPLKLPGKTALK